MCSSDLVFQNFVFQAQSNKKNINPVFQKEVFQSGVFQVIRKNNQSLTEQVSINESVIALKGKVKIIDESEALSENVDKLKQSLRIKTIGEGVSVSETPIRVLSRKQTITEGITISDVNTRSTYRNPNRVLPIFQNNVFQTRVYQKEIGRAHV